MTRIFTQDDDGLIFPIENVYLVRQTQPSSDYYQKTIYACTEKEDAIDRARELNKQYGKGCIFTEDYDFNGVDWEHIAEDCYHYYDVEVLKLDEPFAN